MAAAGSAAAHRSLQLSEWLLDAAVSGLDLATCRKLLSAVMWAVESNAWKGAAVWQAVAVLARLTANIVDCSNSLDKYRTVRKSNPKVREALAVLDGGEAVLLTAGFEAPRRTGGAGAGAEAEALCFPEADAPRLQRLALVNAKLQQLVAYKGFTGLARECDDTGGSTRSRHASAPGFRYQQDIFECSCCSRPINDGSDRLITKKHDAPHGEFRYECESCPGYHLCEGCWDRTR
ncbi:hypothetical protein TSOC_012373 [Tetrabaena socialis]|uniref:PUB domain-containing protein n=1 Tax=Tetrabaena socialis TaxID=47790 RepID=A0A2J7ZN72_9CHLO|nr:hypothetical protein TSOC_012373 [Tetrabaena socialis]|eukprot:PNH01715.1 hypothetical protein TSOC_012373 [Tetrabaena socialis]